MGHPSVAPKAMAYLRTHGRDRVVNAEEIARHTGLREEQINNALRNLLRSYPEDNADLEHVAPGVWRLNTPSAPAPATPRPAARVAAPPAVSPIQPAALTGPTPGDLLEVLGQLTAHGTAGKVLLRAQDGSLWNAERM